MEKALFKEQLSQIHAVASEKTVVYWLSKIDFQTLLDSDLKSLIYQRLTLSQRIQNYSLENFFFERKLRDEFFAQVFNVEEKKTNEAFQVKVFDRQKVKDMEATEEIEQEK